MFGQIVAILRLPSSRGVLVRLHCTDAVFVSLVVDCWLLLLFVVVRRTAKSLL